MMIKIAVPNQFKLKVMPNFRTFFFPDKKYAVCPLKFFRVAS